MSSYKKSLGPRLKQLREEQGLRVEDVAAWIGVHRTHIYSLERGDYPASLETLQNLATAYRCDLADLFVFPTEHPRHRFREFARLIPNAKLVAALERLEKFLGTTLDELAESISSEARKHSAEERKHSAK